MKFHVVRNDSFHDTNLSNKKGTTRDKTYLKKTSHLNERKKF
jgi:hypothetical protein